MLTKVIVVDGIIGAGKTTFIHFLKKEFEAYGWTVVIVSEPVDTWNVEQFYADPQRRSFQFQCKAFHSRVCEFRTAVERNKAVQVVYILERSIFTDVIFADSLHAQKLMDNTEIRDYRSMWTLWKLLLPYDPTMFIYLKPSLSVCMSRISLRRRPGEETISEDYQKNLLARHNSFLLGGVRLFEFINDKKVDLQPVPTLVLRTNIDFKTCQTVCKRMCEDVVRNVNTDKPVTTFRY